MGLPMIVIVAPQAEVKRHPALLPRTYKIRGDEGLHQSGHNISDNPTLAVDRERAAMSRTRSGLGYGDRREVWRAQEHCDEMRVEKIETILGISKQGGQVGLYTWRRACGRMRCTPDLGRSGTEAGQQGKVGQGSRIVHGLRVR